MSQFYLLPPTNLVSIPYIILVGIIEVLTIEQQFNLRKFEHMRLNLLPLPTLVSISWPCITLNILHFWFLHNCKLWGKLKNLPSSMKSSILPFFLQGTSSTCRYFLWKLPIFPSTHSLPCLFSFCCPSYNAYINKNPYVTPFQ